MVDYDTYLSMGFIVGELLIVERKSSWLFTRTLRRYKNIEKDNSPIIFIIKDKGRDRLDSYLYSTLGHVVSESSLVLCGG